MGRPMTAAAQALRPQTRRPKACTEQGFEFLRRSCPLFSTPVRTSEGAAVAVVWASTSWRRQATGREVEMEIEVLPRSHTRLDRSSLSGGRHLLGRQTGIEA